MSPTTEAGRVSVLYAVESGDYSDYVLHCLFTTEELAQRYIEALATAAANDERQWGATTPEAWQAEQNAARVRLTIGLYQLWDALPIVDDGPLYEQGHTEPLAAARTALSPEPDA